MQLLLAVLAFFVSGASALAYQVTWQRLLALHSGIGLYSVTMIVASFMAGLGLGSHLGGVLSVRRSPRQALLAFALIEAGIGVFGALSATLFYDQLYLRGAWLYGVPWRAGLVHFVSLVVPTTLMGMSLPLLVKGMVRNVAGAARIIGVLYAVNMLGASIGALVTPWVLIRLCGLPGALRWAALGNLAAGMAAALLALLPYKASPGSPRGDGAATAAAPQRQPFPLWMSLYATSGFVALALEILWFRMLDVAIKSTPFSFGTMLAIYLGGCALGSLAGAWLAPRTAAPLRLFLASQCALLVTAGLAVTTLATVSINVPFYRWYYNYWQAQEGFVLGASWDWVFVTRLCLILPVFVFGLPTVLMGFSFPILQRAVHDDAATSGRKVGLLQAANIAGCVAGSLLVGLLFLDWWGSMGTLRALTAVGLLFALLGWHRYRGALFPAFAAALLVLVLALPSGDRLWTRLHGRQGSDTLVGEDGTALVALVPMGKGVYGVAIGGRSNSWIPFGGVHTRLGAMPVLMHPEPLDVAVIGLGSGDTAWAAGCRSVTRSVTVFEIARPQLPLLRRVAAIEDRTWLAGLHALLADARVSVRIADGRAALLHETTRYDVIEADPLRPNWSLSGNVHSQQFFELCARRLKPGGLMCSWSPTLRIRRAFRRAFTHVVAIEGDQALIGSNEPIPFDAQTWVKRGESPDVVARLGAPLARSVRAVLATAKPATGRAFAHGQANQDLYPRDEFLTPLE